MCDNLNQKEFYKIHEDRMAELEKKLKRIQKKCEKHGNPFYYEITGSEMVDVNTDKGQQPNMQKYFIIKAEGTAIVNNWEFIATLEARGDENVIRRYNKEVELPERFKTALNICEHCNTNRMRKDLYVVRNIKTNEFKQIGRNCLAEYTRGLSAEFVASVIEWKDMLESEQEDGMTDEYFRGIANNRYHEVKKIIDYAHVITTLFGFSKSDGFYPTSQRISNLLWNKQKTLENWRENDGIDVNMSQFEGNDVAEKTDAIIEYFVNLEDNSEFIHNVKVILNDGYCGSRDFGILASLPYCFDKALGRIKAKEERDAEIQKAKENDALSKYFGETGKRYTAKNVELKLISAFDTFYGIMHIYKFVDADNHVFIWKSGTYQECDKMYNITFTVKSHNEYNGMMQTEVSRCKLIKTENMVSVG